MKNCSFLAKYYKKFTNLLKKKAQGAQKIKKTHPARKAYYIKIPESPVSLKITIYA